MNAHPTRMDLDTETFVVATAGTLCSNGKAAGSTTQQDAEAGMLIAYNVHGANANAKERHAYEADVARCVDQTGGWAPNQGGTCIAHTLRGNGHDASEDGTGRGVPLVPVAFAVFPGVASPTMGVRRLSCTEMERLQGFPDGYTSIPYRGKPAGQCPDGPRAKALGNSMATNVIRWICERIEIVDAIPSKGTP